MIIDRSQPPRPWPADRPKPLLPKVHLPHYWVHIDDLLDYLKQVYKMRLERSYLGLDGVVAEYRVTGQLPAAVDLTYRIRIGKRTRDLAAVLNVLCADGFIPAGKYALDTRARVSPVEAYRRLLEEVRNPAAAVCVAFRDKHHADADFRKKAGLMDAAVSEWLAGE